MQSLLPLDILLPTKLTPPQPTVPWVPRPRIVERLGSAPCTRLTLVIAPAGFGKSTLVAQWLVKAQDHEREGRLEAGGPAPRGRASTVAWLALDEHDQDPLRFLAYVVGAVHRVLPDALPTAASLLRAPETPPLYVILQALLIDLGNIRQPLTLVLDDYHTIAAEPIHQAVAYLLRHLPTHCHIVIASRTDPPFSLTRLEAERQVTELRAAELRFTEPEAEDLLTRLTGTTPEGERLAALMAQTEGWALALQMAALVHYRTGSGADVGAITRRVADYLGDEVLAVQPPRLQQALLSLAVPERFCADLCATLLDLADRQSEGEVIVEEIVAANLFVIALDNEGHWYRFHHLFRELLIGRLRRSAGEQAVRTLHGRAAGWFAAEGLVEEAVRHFLAACDEDAAAAVIERRGAPLGTFEARQVRRWLRLLPPELIARRPGLTLLEASIHSNSIDVAAVEQALGRVDRLLELAPPVAPPWPSFPADRDALLADVAHWRGRAAETIAAIERSRSRVPPTRAAHSLLVLYLHLAAVGEGRYAEDVRATEEQLAADDGSLAGPQRLLLLTNLVGMHLLAGELEALEQAARRIEAMVAAQPHVAEGTFFNYAPYALGIVTYERNQLGAAATSFAAIEGMKYYAPVFAYVSSVSALAAIAAAQSDRAAAEAYAGDLAAFARETGGQQLSNQAAGCAVRNALAAGDVAAAVRAARTITPDLHLGVSVWFEAPLLSKARALIAAAKPDTLAEADEVLGHCLTEVEGLHNTRLLIATLAIRALLRRAQNRHDEAETDLALALALGEPRGFLRTFADLGPPLVPLLYDLAARGVAGAYVERIMAVISPGQPFFAEPVAAPVKPEIPELLTRRESEILALLAERLTDQEIADRLVISLFTVRRHATTIYDKLGVHSRREAVTAGRALGLLRGGPGSSAVMLADDPDER